MIVVVVVLGAGVGVGLALIAIGLFSTANKVEKPSLTRALDLKNRQAGLTAVVFALIAGLVTHWPVGVAIGGATGWVLRSALQPATSKSTVDRLEALAAWIESLRDAVATQRGLTTAIASTVPTAPPSIRANVEMLSARINAGMTPADALESFATELDDAAVDEAIAPLMLASRFAASNLQGLLSTAARTTREQIAVWQRTEIARAKPRRDMRLVIAITLIFTVIVLIVGHGYFAPFGTAIGQVFLLFAVGLFAAGFFAMNRLSTPVAMPRLFAKGDGSVKEGEQ